MRWRVSLPPDTDWKSIRTESRRSFSVGMEFHSWLENELMCSEC